ncbi:MAG: TRAP transporter small permease [Bilophila wadsworthia]
MAQVLWVIGDATPPRARRSSTSFDRKALAKSGYRGPSAILGRYHEGLRWLDEWAEEFCVSIMLSLLILLLGTEVFSRFLLSKSFSWIEELCRYLFVWASYLGVAIAVKRKEQLRVLMLMDTLEKHFPRLVKVCYVVSELSFAVFCVLVFYYSINMLENMTRFKQVSASLEINVMYAYLIIPISMAVTTFRVLQGLYRDFRNHTLHFQGRGD